MNDAFDKSLKIIEERTDFYGILRCKRHNSPEQINTEYRKLCLYYHPDKNSQYSEASRENFERIQEAYTVLGDAEKRKEYDQYLDSGLCVSYSTWKKHCLGKRAETVHWRNGPQTMALTEVGANDGMEGTSSSFEECGNRSKKSSSDDLYRQFRNYEI